MFAFSDIHHPIISFYMGMLMYLIFVVSEYAELEQDKLCNWSNIMDYYTVSVKTADVLIVEVIFSGAKYLVWGS